jgi:hypothetical protein
LDRACILTPRVVPVADLVIIHEVDACDAEDDEAEEEQNEHARDSDANLCDELHGNLLVARINNIELGEL